MVLFDGTLPPIDPSAPYTFRDAVDAYGTRGVGECVGGQLHGKGRREYADGTVHTGGFARGKADGSGACHYANGDVYDGQFARGERSGEGVLRWAAGHTYEGAWAADEPDGVGTMVWVDADREEVKRYAGQWRHGRRHGAGVQTWADGRRFEGQWADGAFEFDGGSAGVAAATVGWVAQVREWAPPRLGYPSMHRTELSLL